MSTDNLLGFAALAVLLVSGALWFRAALAVRLPANRTPYVIVWAVCLLTAVATLLGSATWPGITAALLTLVGSAFFLMTVAISRQILGADAITVGAAIPAFSAPDESGQVFESATLAGQPLLLKFFRGHW